MCVWIVVEIHAHSVRYSLFSFPLYLSLSRLLAISTLSHSNSLSSEIDMSRDSNFVEHFVEHLSLLKPRMEKEWLSFTPMHSAHLLECYGSRGKKVFPSATARWDWYGEWVSSFCTSNVDSCLIWQFPDCIFNKSNKPTKAIIK